MWVTGPLASLCHQTSRRKTVPFEAFRVPTVHGEAADIGDVNTERSSPVEMSHLPPNSLPFHRDIPAPSGAADGWLRRAEAGWLELELEPKGPAAVLQITHARLEGGDRQPQLVRLPGLDSHNMLCTVSGLFFFIVVIVLLKYVKFNWTTCRKAKIKAYK